MLTSRLWTLCLGTTVALTASAGVVSAQTTKSDAAKAGRTAPPDGDDATSKDDAEAKTQRPPSPFNNPAMQMRALKAMVGGMPGMPGGGGRGGFGGGNGMTTLLMNSKTLQEEINLTEEQKAKLKEVNDTANQARRDLFTQMGNQRGGNQRGGNQRGGQQGQRGGQQIDRQAMTQAMETINTQMMTGISKILDKTQKERLNQIELRIIGVTAVMRPDVAKKLNLNPIQISQLETIMAQLATAQQELMASQRGMFGRGGPGAGPGGPGAAPGGPGRPGAAPGGATNRRQPGGNTAPATKGETTKDDAPGNNGRPQRPDFNSPEMQERMAQISETMTKMNEKAEELDKKVEVAIGKVLTKGQKTKFNAMLGADFDLTKLAEDTGRGGRGGGNQRGGNTRGGATNPRAGNPAVDNN